MWGVRINQGSHYHIYVIYFQLVSVNHFSYVKIEVSSRVLTAHAYRKSRLTTPSTTVATTPMKVCWTNTADWYSGKLISIQFFELKSCWTAYLPVLTSQPSELVGVIFASFSSFITQYWSNATVIFNNNFVKFGGKNVWSLWHFRRYFAFFVKLFFIEIFFMIGNFNLTIGKWYCVCLTYK